MPFDDEEYWRTRLPASREAGGVSTIHDEKGDQEMTEVRTLTIDGEGESAKARRVLHRALRDSPEKEWFTTADLLRFGRYVDSICLPSDDEAAGRVDAAFSVWILGPENSP